jgi:hypothetical protein
MDNEGGRMKTIMTGRDMIQLIAVDKFALEQERDR